MPDELEAWIEQIRTAWAEVRAQAADLQARSAEVGEQARPLVRRLKDLGLSEVRIAELLGVDRGTLRRWIGKQDR